MSIESGLSSELGINFAADGALPDVGVYPHIAPQDASYPFVIYSVTDADIENYLNSTTRTLTEITFDLSIHSEFASERALILDNIKTNLHGFSGDIGTENINVRSSVIQSVSTFSEADLTGTDEQIYRASLSLTLFYNWS